MLSVKVAGLSVLSCLWNRVLPPRPRIAFHHDAMHEYAHSGHSSIAVTEE